MKNKIKKWHIALMSFLALFATIFASLFSLRADTIDEETGEIVTDNWELGVVFYDSTVNNGKTPLTEINWDASDGGYGIGETRIITMQINYKNTNSTRTYQPQDLTITIPNLFYSSNYGSATKGYYGKDHQIYVSSLLGANDYFHSGFDWFLYEPNSGSPQLDISDKNIVFKNTNTIEEKSNFEGSIQIQYTVTPMEEGNSYYVPIEQYLNECTVSLQKEIKATLEYYPQSPIITSLNWPNNYDNNLSSATTFWEYTNPNLENLDFIFDDSSKLEDRYDYIYIYDQSGKLVYSLTGSEFHKQTYHIDGNYMKITMKTNWATNYKGFAIYFENKNFISSNTINFNYTRTYNHPWERKSYTLEKTASKITSLDLLPNANDFIWVKFSFKTQNNSTSYPYIYANSKKIKDTFPEECVVTSAGIVLEPKNNEYTIDIDHKGSATIIVGYPKSIYNSENNNLNITNTAYLYGIYSDSTEETFLAEDDVSLNLANFEFSYSGNLYGISKEKSSISSSLRYQTIVNNRQETNNYWKNYNTSSWNIYPTAIYTGTPITVKFGDDLLYGLNNENTYVKLDDDEYCFRLIQLVGLYNGQNTSIQSGKYNCELWLRYENNTEYVLYREFTNSSGSWSFTEEDKVVGYYFIIHDMNESISNKSNVYFYTQFKKPDIAESGSFYNFSYIQVFTKDENGNLILQNEPDLNSYANFITQNEIATHDIETYGTYMQRATDKINWYYYNVPQPNQRISAIKKAYSVHQDNINEKFTFNFTIGAQLSNSTGILKFYYNDIEDDRFITGFKIYDLLPLGVKLESTPEEILESCYIYFTTLASHTCTGKILNINKEEIDNATFINLIKNNDSINIVENWNNTGRTKIEINIDFENYPILFIGNSHGTGGDDTIQIRYTLNANISYDTYLEFGAVWTNNSYVCPQERDTLAVVAGEYYSYPSTKSLDNGQYDSEANDINENNSTSDYVSVATDSITIKAVVSTHQEILKLVKTNLSDFSTKTVPSDCNSEYTYKLRIRTGQNDITNLIIYDFLETAQPERTRWQGEFLGIDTSYAENKIHRLYKPNDPNADTEGYITYKLKINPYWTSNPNAGNLYNEDGTLNTNWQTYSETTDKTQVKALAFEYVNEDGTPAVFPASHLTYVLIKMKSPADESITTLARNDCYTQWNAIDEFGQTVDFITGINSNVVKVALPNSIDEDSMPSVTLKFIKEIIGTDSEFENMKLDKTDQQTFMIRLTSLTANENGSYNQVTALLKSDQELIISQIPVGTYLLEELGDNYFDFVDFSNNNDPEIIIEGVTFERTDQGYIITVSEDLTENIEFNIKVTNEIEPERFYEDKNSQENLFLKNKIEENE